MPKWIVALVTVLSMSSTTVAGQTLLYMRIGMSTFECGQPCPTLVALDPDTMSIERRGPGVASGGTTSAGAAYSNDLYVTPDGGVILWLEASPTGVALAMHDVRTRAVSSLPLQTATQNRMLGNPRRAEIYLGDEGGPLALSLAGPRRFAPASCNYSAPAAISDDGARVAYGSCAGGVVIFDTSTGAVVNTLPFMTHLALDGGGAHLYGVWQQAANQRSLRRYDVATGTVVGEAPLPESGDIQGVVRIPSSGQIVFRGAGIRQVYDAQLALLATTPGGGQGHSSQSVYAFEPHQTRDFTLSRILQPGGSMTFDLGYCDGNVAQGTCTRSGALTTHSGALGLSVAPRPPAPVALAAQVSGSSVQLTWAPGPTNATTLRHQLQVGSAPGQSDIYSGLELGPDTSFAASGVPPGRYYVRVRAGNHTGFGAASNEVLVLVP